MSGRRATCWCSSSISSARARAARTLIEITQREKDIRYSSRTRMTPT